ncbi:MAG: phage tail protein [Hyphomicrobiales bacterium]|nr:phage tail protein [Hyphomicrobiales bacterium]
MFAWLGSIQIGISSFTGPTGADEKTKSTFARLAVASGKPVVQDIGDELAVKKLTFFFDDSFCTPKDEIAKLEQARTSRAAMPFAYGDGTYTGAHYVVEEIDVKIKKTSPSGTLLRIEADLQLLEIPTPDLAAMNAALARQSAQALSTNISLNVLAQTG